MAEYGIDGRVALPENGKATVLLLMNQNRETVDKCIQGIIEKRRFSNISYNGCRFYNGSAYGDSDFSWFRYRAFQAFIDDITQIGHDIEEALDNLVSLFVDGKPITNDTIGTGVSIAGGVSP